MSKTTVRLAIILAVLWGGVFIYKQASKKTQHDDTVVQSNFFSNIDVDKINSISVIKNGATTTLEKSGDLFKIAGTKGFYATEEVAKTISDGLIGAKNANLKIASINEDNKIDFLTNASGTKVIIAQEDGEQVDFIIGRTGTDPSETYIAQEGKPETYMISENMPRVFDTESWYNKNIFKSDKELINQIRFQYLDRQFTISKNKKGVWSGVNPNKFTVSQEKILAILDAMSGLKALKIPKQTFNGTELEKHAIIVQATGDKIDNTIMIGGFVKQDGSESKLYYAKKGDNDNIYLISEEDKKILDKTIKDLQ